MGFLPRDPRHPISLNRSRPGWWSREERWSRVPRSSLVDCLNTVVGGCCPSSHGTSERMRRFCAARHSVIPFLCVLMGWGWDKPGMRMLASELTRVSLLLCWFLRWFYALSLLPAWVVVAVDKGRAPPFTKCGYWTSPPTVISLWI
jgi:hypothetical protein